MAGCPAERAGSPFHQVKDQLLNRIRANRDLLPVGPVGEAQARHGARAADGQMNESTRILRRRHTRRIRRRDIGERRSDDLFTASNLFKTTW